MKVLVAVASKHGSTREIGESIAEELRAGGHDVDFRETNQTLQLEGYEATVMGSAVYMGNWLPEAQHFIERHRSELAEIPVWLFSSGPLGDSAHQVPGAPQSVPEFVQQAHAREHRIFVGKLDPSDLGFMERIVTKIVHAPEGDFRDWDGIRAWARDIGESLGAGS